MNFLKMPAILWLCVLSIGCQSNAPAPVTDEVLTTGNPDPHSFSKPSEAVTKHLDLHLKADFQKKTLEGTARWKIEHTEAGSIIFDIRDLDIKKVSIAKAEGADKTTRFALGKTVEHLGQALKVTIEPETQYVTIHYATRPQSAAILWLEKEQTQGKVLPFLFTQGQAVLTRSWIPCQDSPGIRVTYYAEIEVPPGMLAVMSAVNPTEKSADGKYQFKMEQSIPPYLIALAAGDLVFEPLTTRTGIYSEPDMVDDAHYEFDKMEDMVVAAETLFGPYPWERYDILVLPPSFPFGGMENPRLTFATPTIIAGDRSLTSLIAHELAHSWSGNLVTNATWDDFWLNEGLTTYTERRIMEALYGKDYAEMLAIIGFQDLEADLLDLGADSPDSHLKLKLQGRDPDEASTDVAYEKGAFFFRMLEEKVGRAQFDEFLKLYFSTYRFKTITTEAFIEFLNQHLIQKYGLEVNTEEWIYGPGIPANCPKVTSARFEKVEQVIRNFDPDNALNGIDKRTWTAFEMIHFLRMLPRDYDNRAMKMLDYGLDLSESPNAEIQAAWYELAVYNGYSMEILPRIEEFLIKVGRRKFLVPIYKAFVARGQLETAHKIYQKARPGYHAVSSGTIDEILKWEEGK